MSQGIQWPFVWDGRTLNKHLPFYNRSDDWDKVVEETSGPPPVGRYAPWLPLAEIEAIERACIENGLKNSESEIPSVKANLRSFWMDAGTVIGANDGELATLVFVWWNMSGSFHGFPITMRQLQRKIAHATNRS